MKKNNSMQIIIIGCLLTFFGVIAGLIIILLLPIDISIKNIVSKIWGIAGLILGITLTVIKENNKDKPKKPKKNKDELIPPKHSDFFDD